MAKRKASRWASEAAMQALVRFGPELSGLKALQRTAEADYKQSVRSAHGTSAGIINAVDVARPQVASIYTKAGRQASQAYGVTSQDMASLGPVANSIRAAASLEQQGTQARLAESGASSLTDLAQRRVAAKSGEQWAVTSAHDKLVTDLTKVLQRKQDLLGEKGAFTALTESQLTDAARKRAADLTKQRRALAQQERSSIRSSGIDPATGKPIPGGKLDPKAKKGTGGPGGDGWASQAAQAAAADKIAAAKHWAAQLKSVGLGRHDVARSLLTGQKAKNVPLHDDNGRPLYWKAGEKGNEKGDKTGEPKTHTLPELPKIDSELYLSVALDAAYDGHISARNQKLLHDRGIKIGPLGLKTRGQWDVEERKRKRGQRTPAGQAGTLAGILGAALLGN
jgi:hypothetical protein